MIGITFNFENMKKEMTEHVGAQVNKQYQCFGLNCRKQIQDGIEKKKKTFSHDSSGIASPSVLFI